MSDIKTLVAHLGLGDSILLSGAAVVLAKSCARLRVPCYERYLESVKSFYAYHPEIEVYPVDNPVFSAWGVPPIECFDIVGDPLICGFYKCWRGSWDKSFPELFYRQLEIDYHHRWDSCPISAAWRKVEQIAVTPQCLIHDDWKRGLKIDRNVPKDAYRLHASKRSVLEHAFAIQNATEIHCVDSSIMHLVECVDTKGELYLHRYARHYRGRETDYPSRKQWSILI